MPPITFDACFRLSRVCSPASASSRFTRSSCRPRLPEKPPACKTRLSTGFSTSPKAVGLVVLIHNDMDVPFAKEGSEPAYLDQMKALFRRHPNTTIIWAHTGMGRVVRPIKNHAAHLAEILADPQFSHVYFDISWDEVAKYVLSSPEATRVTADLLNRYPDRFLFGTDEVAPSSQEKYLKVYYQYEPLWKLLDAKTSEKVRKETTSGSLMRGGRK